MARPRDPSRRLERAANEAREAHEARAVRARRPATAGFTLIELLIAVMIIAVMIAAGIKISAWIAPESELAAEADMLRTEIELSRSEAIVTGRVVWLQFELGDGRKPGQSFRSINEPEPGKELDAEADEFTLTVREWRSLPRTVRIDSIIVGEQDPWTDGRVSIAIQPDGTMPSHLIRLTAPELDESGTRESGWACVQVAGLLGQARVLNRFVEPKFLREETFE